MRYLIDYNLLRIRSRSTSGRGSFVYCTAARCLKTQSTKYYIASR